MSDDIDSAPPIPELGTEMPADDNPPEHDQAADQSISEVTDEPELPSLDSAIPEINDQTVEMQVSDDSEVSQAADSSELPAISESEDAFPDIPDVPDVPDIPEEDEFIEDDSEDLPAQFRSSSDPSIEEESDKSSFDPVHGRKKIIGADLPKPESPGATWAALILLILPFALLFQAYSGAESQSFLSFLITYFFGFLFIQSLIYVQKFLAGIKPDASWINCLIPNLPLYQKTNLGNPVCPQPLAMICSVMIILALYAQPQIMAMHKKNMAAELAKAEAEAKPKQIKK